ncbi:MAG: ribose-5-phosphate isomerase RpiA [Pseudomonadota bacterium]
MSDLAKINAAAAALNYVKSGMTIGLGTGSTAAHFVRLLGERVRQGLSVRGVPTSEATRRQAEEVGVPLIELDQATQLDLDIDGADEIDPQFRLIKGGGAALLREKIVASASVRMIVIADDSKAVAQLGAFPLPIEVIPFGHTFAVRRIAEVLKQCGCPGTEIVLRQRGGATVITDGGNYVLDAHVQRIPDPETLAQALKQVTGVVEHGLFLGLARTLILGRERGAEIKEL